MSHTSSHSPDGRATVPASVIVLSWNGRRWLDDCFQAIAALAPAPAEVILVDNASTDGTTEYVRSAFPFVRVVALGVNRGFAGGNNEGARAASSPHLVFLNNDTRVDPKWLGELVAAAADPSVGLVTSQIVLMGEPARIDSAGDGYLRCGGAFKHAHGELAAHAPASREVFGACGAAFLIRRDLFETLGGFDEDFFMVYEDVDLSYRARLAGARCVYAARARVLHAGSGSIGRVSRDAVYYGQRNLEWTWLKNTPARWLWRSLPSHVAYGIASGLAYGAKGFAGTWLRAKFAAIAGLPVIWRKRRRIQHAAEDRNAGAVWQWMEADWIGRKRREKQFDFGAFRTPVTAARSSDRPGDDSPRR